MRCDFCGKECDEQAAERACRSCAMLGGCRMLKCPHCGYERPRDTRLVRWLRAWREGRCERSAR